MSMATVPAEFDDVLMLEFPADCRNLRGCWLDANGSTLMARR
ncbi:MAG: hypothetical protein ACKO3P_16785 [Planctomycetaceae bacterium]